MADAKRKRPADEFRAPSMSRDGNTAIVSHTDDEAAQPRPAAEDEATRLAQELRARRDAADRCPPMPCGHRDTLDCR